MNITISGTSHNILFKGKKAKEFDPKQVVDLYKQGLTTNEIYKQTGCSFVRLKKILSVLPDEKDIIAQHAYNSKHLIATTLKENDIIDMYKQGIPVTEIAERYNCYAQVIRNIIKKQHNAKELQIINKNELRFEQEIQDQMLELYKKGYHIGYIANKYNCSKTAVRKVLSQFGNMENLKKIHQQNHLVAIEKLKEEIFAFYKQVNENIFKVADKFGYNSQTIFNLISKMNK